MFDRIKRHYEKIICACCFLILFTNIGLPSTSFSVYQPFLVELPGVGHTGGAVVISVRTFVSLIAMFFVARYYRLLDCRVGVLVSSACVAAGFVLYGFAQGNFIALCVGSVLTGLGYGMGGMVASTMLIGRWFRSHTATAAGIAAVGSGVAAVLIPPLAVALIDVTSLSIAFVAEGCLAAAVGLLVFFLLRNRPEDMGLEPYVCEGDRGRFRSQRTRVNRGIPHSWVPLVFVAMVFVGAISVGGNNYLAVLFTSEGYPVERAAAFVALGGACLTVAKLLTGVCFDRWGTLRGSIVFFSLFILGTALLCVSALGYEWLAPIAVVVFSVGLSLGTVGISIWSIELAPQGRQVQTIKNFQIAYALGGFVCTFLPGFLMDAFGTYVVSYLLLLVLVVVAAVIVVGIYSVLASREARTR